MSEGTFCRVEVHINVVGFFIDDPICYLMHDMELIKRNKYKKQRTNGPANAHLISWPSKAQNIQNLELYSKEMTLTFNTHIPP